MNSGVLFLISAAYLALLFFVASRGDKASEQRSISRKPWVWSLGLAVYCTSWTYYGAVGRAAVDPLSYLPIYLGPILMFTLGYPLLRRLIEVSKRNSLTSVADFIAARYGNDPLIAALATMISVLAVLPYIALQLKAVAQSFAVLAPQQNLDVALLTAVSLGIFSVLYGTRHLSSNESHHGLLVAVAFESTVKLFAFLTVALLVLNVDSAQVWSAYAGAVSAPPSASSVASFICQTLLAALAVLCLPRQFHITAVENAAIKDLNTARWVFPIYLILISLPVIPLASLGMQTLAPGVNADTYMLRLPLEQGNQALAVVAFIGGFSAGTAMVIVSSIALSVMVSNEVVMPWLLRSGQLRNRSDLGEVMMRVRRITIVGLIALAYLFYQLLAADASLAATGLLAFVGIAQLAPSLIGAMFWSGGNRKGVLAGMIVGALTWAYTLLLPALSASQYWFAGESSAWSWLAPRALFGWSLYEPVVHATIWSLGLNVLAFVGVSVLTRASLREQLDVVRFVAPNDAAAIEGVSVGDLQLVLERFYGRDRSHGLLTEFNRGLGRESLDLDRPADQMVLDFVERLLAAAMGASTARALLAALLNAPRDTSSDVAMVLDQTSSLVRFNRELLHATLDHLGQAVSVIDANQRLVAWNRRYIEIFDLPPELLRVGEPIENIVRFNASRGLLGGGDLEWQIHRRLQHLRERNRHRHERTMPDGRILEIAGEPMPGGGFISTFADITEYKRTQKALEQSNIGLEKRVRERTEDLEKLNTDLQQARAEADKANLSKTRFLAAASHDLMQPLNAARLFASTALQGDINAEKSRALLSNIELSLDSMEELLDSLLDISKLDAGVLPVHADDIALAPIFAALNREFALSAQKRGLKLVIHPSSSWIRTDPALIKRILQNFLANALRYTEHGRVVVGARRLPGHLRIEVLDTGPGIENADLGKIFEEFHRLEVRRAGVERGVGLGLSICQRIAELLGHALTVRSVVGRGSAFCVTVPVAEPNPRSQAEDTPPAVPGDRLKAAKILCVDNDPEVLKGMAVLLESWGCEVSTAVDQEDALIQLVAARPEIVVVDFHLDRDRTGVQLLAALNAQAGRVLPGIIVTADPTNEAHAQAEAMGYRVLRKPIRPAAFRAILSRLR